MQFILVVYLGDIAFCNSLAGQVEVLKSISFMINVKYHNTSAVLEHYHEVFKVSCIVILLFHFTGDIRSSTWLSTLTITYLTCPFHSHNW